MTGATCANTGYLKINACANQSVTAYINIPDFCDSRYLWYVLQSAREELLTYKTGGAQGGINVKDCANIKVCLPPLAEQEAIAKYLDYKAVQVDSIIDNNQHQIALLEELKSSVISHAVTRGINLDVPLKASGVDGLGDIPQHWKTTLFKRLLREPMMYGANESAESYKESEPRFIRITDITLDGKLNNDNKASLSRSKAIKYMLHKGDLLFARSGATVGKCYLFKEDIEACFAGYLIKAQCDKELMPEYMRYYCQSHYYNEWKAQSFIQSTIQNISAERYSYLPVTLPPVDEQEAIAKYLDQRTAKINAQIAKIQMQNQLLQEYKSSLISEVVTGKRKVID